MVGGDIRHNADIAMVKAQTRTNNSAARRFENGDIDRRIFQNKLSGNGSGIIARDDLLILDISSVGRRKSDRSAAAFQDMRDQARRRRFAVRSGDRKDRDARRRSGREKHVDDMFGDVSADAFATAQDASEIRARH